MAKIQYAFYSTLGCHLCDEAEALFTQILPSQSIQTIEISTSDTLMELYGTSIPVLKRLDTAQELAWPFDIKTLTHFIQ